MSSKILSLLYLTFISIPNKILSNPRSIHQDDRDLFSSSSSTTADPVISRRQGPLSLLQETRLPTTSSTSKRPKSHILLEFTHNVACSGSAILFPTPIAAGHPPTPRTASEPPHTRRSARARKSAPVAQSQEAERETRRVGQTPH